MSNAEATVPQGKGVHAEQSVTVNHPVEALYAFWRNPVNLPQVIEYVESVEIIDNDRAHWKIKLPGGMTGEFDAEVYTDVPNEVISWRSIPGSEIQNAGSVRFSAAPEGRGCEVRLSLEFVPPAGVIGKAVLGLFPHITNEYISQYLRDFKRMMETGETPTNRGQTSGREKEATS